MKNCHDNFFYLREWNTGIKICLREEDYVKLSHMPLKDKTQRNYEQIYC